MNDMGNLKCTCEACPTQYEGDVDGYPAYFRGRYGWWSFTITERGGDPILPKTKEEVLFHREEQFGDEYDGNVDRAEGILKGLVEEFRNRETSMKCGHCGSGKGEFFLTNPPFHVDKDQCIRNLRAELVAIEKRTQSPAAGSDCGAGNYFDELKCHGCALEIPCEHCGIPFCKHWPYCPRCILQRFRDVEKRAQRLERLEKAIKEHRSKIQMPDGKSHCSCKFCEAYEGK